MSRCHVLLLRLTLFVDGVIAIALALRELELIPTIMSGFFVALLLGIGAANLYGLYSLGRGPSWPRNVALAQGSVAVLATYIVFMAVRSYTPNWRTFWITSAVGLVAIAWVLRVWRGVSVSWTRSTAIIAAVIPLAGLVQFWLQSEYLPNLTAPMVEISAELSPAGRTGSTIHLSAKLTFHNRGTFVVLNPAGLMRVTAYPKNLQPTASPCSTDVPIDTSDARNADLPAPTLLEAMDPTASDPDLEFRSDPARVDQCELLLAEFTGDFGAYLAPGSTSTIQKDIDVDANAIRLVRLSGSGVFLTERRLRDVRACFPDKNTPKTLNPLNWPIQASMYDKDPSPYFQEAKQLWQSEDQSEYFCIDYELKPRSVFQEMLSGSTVLRVKIVLGRRGNRFNEYPQIEPTVGLAADIDKPQSPDEQNKLQQANPIGIITDVTAEYAPSDPPPRGGPEHESAKASG